MGSPTYKGLVEWEDVFEGEKSANSFATADRNVERLIQTLKVYIANGTLLTLQIKRVESD